MSKYCRICHSTKLGPPIELREMMFLTGEMFDYVQCVECECLQIAELPANIDRFYPKDYYSFDPPPRRIRDILRDWLTLHGNERLFGRFDWFQRGALRSVAHVARNSKILDVGCGQGDLIAALATLGFTNVSGLDAFVPERIVMKNGAIVEKGDLDQATGKYDVVMLHHSLEHMWDQHRALCLARDLLSDEGQMIIRIPTVDSWQWKTFGEHWAHLDPPRHFYLHSRNSIRIALHDAGLTVTRIVDDSNKFGVLGSLKASFGRSTIDTRPLPEGTYEELVAQVPNMNRQGRGDSIAVYAAAIGAK